MIFVGEHTSYTHAWIASALESGIRGSVQLMLELGLVDEAKATVEKWMARWIEVVSTVMPLNGFQRRLLIRCAVNLCLPPCFRHRWWSLPGAFSSLHEVLYTINKE